MGRVKSYYHKHLTRSPESDAVPAEYITSIEEQEEILYELFLDQINDFISEQAELDRLDQESA